MINFLSIWIR